ncbi:MAG: Flp pilus assembly protein CpaB [bacterium]|nr:Flp pilus assembly protein CpaB [bacterium]
MNRLRVFLFLAIIVLAVAAVLVFLLPQLSQSGTTPTPAPGDSQVVQQPVEPQGTPLPTATPLEFVSLVLAVQDLPRGFRITPNAVTIREWPLLSAPFNGITSLEDVVGKIARTDIFREQPILTNMVVDDLLDLARVGSDVAAILPEGLVAVAIPVDRLTSVAYGIQDGDHVDLIVSLLFVDVDEAFQSISPNQLTLFSINEDGSISLQEPIEGRPDSTSLGPVIVGPSERQRPRLVSQMTIQDAIILHVGNFPPDGRYIGIPSPTPAPPPDSEDEEATPIPPTPTPARDIVTLGVSPQDAVVLTWMIEARIPVTLAIRAVNDTSRAATSEVTLDYIMTTYGIELPGKRPYSIEPAIRSIRQLLADNQISLAE